MDERTLTLAVSGKLWNRSLVMMDTQTRSLWSHLLGQAMSGSLKGESLQVLPSELTTWKAWRTQHPKTTVLNMSRTHRDYVKDFYRHPEKFVYGLLVEGRPYHVPMDVLQRNSVLNLDLKEKRLLVTFDPESASARLFSRKIGERTLNFSARDDNRMQDEETETIWNRSTGQALQEPLEREALKQQVGILSYAKAWKKFHPESREIRLPD